MLPFQDGEKRRGTALVTRLLIGFDLLVFAWEFAVSGDTLERVLAQCGLTPSAVVERFDAWPFVTSLFLHGGVLHIVSNLWALWVFGGDVEERLGSTRFLVFYLASGIAAGAVHVATNLGSDVPTIGASGAIAGVMGAYFVLFPRSQVVALVPIFCFPLFLRLPALVYLGVWFGLQVWGGVGALVGHGNAGGIAWWAHIGGFLAGIALLQVLKPRERTPPTS
jgi:membrane associated rhomboid family serine protease